MTKNKCSDGLNKYWQLFVTIGLILLYVIVILISNDADKAHGRMRHDVTALQEIKKANKKGKRNTYCDQLRHLVFDHNYPSAMVDECLDAPETDLEVTLRKVKR